MKLISAKRNCVSNWHWRCSFEQAQKLAQLEVLKFLKQVQKRGIVLEYGVEDLMQDIRTLRQLGQL